MNPRIFQTETALQTLLVEQALPLAKQLEHAADAAADGQVLSRVEALAVPAGRELTRRAVQAALQTQAEAAEKKGRPAAPVHADGGCGPRARPGGTS